MGGPQRPGSVQPADQHPRGLRIPQVGSAVWSQRGLVVRGPCAADRRCYGWRPEDDGALRPESRHKSTSICDSEPHGRPPWGLVSAFEGDLDTVKWEPSHQRLPGGGVGAGCAASLSWSERSAPVGQHGRSRAGRGRLAATRTLVHRWGDGGWSSPRPASTVSKPRRRRGPRSGAVRWAGTFRPLFPPGTRTRPGRCRAP